MIAGGAVRTDTWPSESGVPPGSADAFGRRWGAAMGVTLAAVPKSKVRKRDDNNSLSRSSRTPVSVDKMLAPSPVWYPITMCVVLVLGLAWIVVYYLAGERVPIMQDLGSWNFAISFGLMVVGLGMAVRWR